MDVDVQIPQLPRNSPDNLFFEKKLNVYEYNIFGRLNFWNTPTGALGYLTEFNTGLLKWQSRWEITSDDGILFKVNRFLKCMTPPDIPDWSISIQLAEKLQVPPAEEIADQRIMPFGIQMVHTATRDNPELKIYYLIDEATSGRLITNITRNLWVSLEIGVVEVRGLENIISPTIDFTSKFDASNVVLEIKGQTFHFIYDLLFMHSQYFYEKWSSDCHDVTPEGGYFLKLDVEDDNLVNGFIGILKYLLYKRPIDSGNVEDILAAAKLFQFEMIMASCEDFLIKDPTVPPNKKMCLAFQYDMSGLQHALNNVSPSTLNTVTSAKFSFPEMMTEFTFDSQFLVATGVPKSTLDEAVFMFDWSIMIEHDFHNQRVEYFMRPAFCFNNFAALNWSITLEFTITINGKTTSAPHILNSLKPKIHGFLDLYDMPRGESAPYQIKLNINSVHGLRYQIDPPGLWKCEVKAPSATLLLQTSDKKFFVNGNYLAFFSDYFKTSLTHLEMFPIDPDSGLPVMDFRDTPSEILEMLLSMVYPSKPTIYDLSNIDQVMPVIDRYLFVQLMRDFETSLVHNIALNQSYIGVKYLDIAMKYNMKTLKFEYLNKFTSASDIHALGQDPDFPSLSDEIKGILMNQLMTLPLQIPTIPMPMPQLIYIPFM